MVEHYREFLAAVILRAHLPRIPDDVLRVRFVETLTHLAAVDGPPSADDYWRLNIRAQRPP
ncbi:MAG: hypothetical protein M0Z94_15700 [Dehalococcoidales bacterium]|nr:hypothetical protein [Dehalococcoidales bacterium]